MTTKLADANLVYNLRFRWKEELKQYKDHQLVQMYDDFCFTEDAEGRPYSGNNDERFLEFVKGY